MYSKRYITLSKNRLELFQYIDFRCDWQWYLVTQTWRLKALSQGKGLNPVFLARVFYPKQTVQKMLLNIVCMYNVFFIGFTFYNILQLFVL